jgi:hypothetical protein
MPSRRLVAGSQPSAARSRALSLVRPRTPGGRGQGVTPLEPHAGGRLDDVDELIHRHQLGAAEIARLPDGPVEEQA